MRRSLRFTFFFGTKVFLGLMGIQHSIACCHGHPALVQVFYLFFGRKNPAYDLFAHQIVHLVIDMHLLEVEKPLYHFSMDTSWLSDHFFYGRNTHQTILHNPIFLTILQLL